MGANRTNVFLLLIMLACVIPFTVGDRLLPASIVLARKYHIQPYQFLPPGFPQTQNPYHLYSLYNSRNSLGNSLGHQSYQLGPFFGYFPNLFRPASPITTTTTTIKPDSNPAPSPDPVTSCTYSSSKGTICPPCTDLTATSGTIRSKNYADNQNFDNDMSCRYTIEVKSGKTIKLTASTGAYLDVTDGEALTFRDSSGGARGELAGPFPTTNPQLLGTSTTNKLTLVFTSDTTTCSSGKTCKWEVLYEQV